MSAPLRGAGLFNLRDLQTETLLKIYVAVPNGPEAETRLFSTVRRILLERGELS